MSTRKHIIIIMIDNITKAKNKDQLLVTFISIKLTHFPINPYNTYDSLIGQEIIDYLEKANAEIIYSDKFLC